VQLNRQDRRRLTQLKRELWKMSGAQTFDEWQRYKSYRCHDPYHADIVEQEIAALMRGDVQRAHAIRTKRESTWRAVKAFWVQQNLPSTRWAPNYRSWLVTCVLLLVMLMLLGLVMMVQAHNAQAVTETTSAAKAIVLYHLPTATTVQQLTL
jgi:hypothetical protein